MSDLEAQAEELRNQLRARLKSLLAIATDIDATLKDVNQVQNELDVEGKPINLLKSRLDRSYDRITADANREISFIDDTIHSLDALSAVQAKLPPPAEAVEPTERGTLKRTASSAAAQQPPSKKRQRETGSVGPGQATSTAVSTPSPVGTPTPVTRKPSVRGRRDMITSQLPLVEGRPVAFRLPGRSGQGKEDWILAKVVSLIGQDKTRYVVQDVDYDPKSAGQDGGVYNTNIKSLVPLPDPRDRAKTYPESDFPPGTPVMALYPDTTSFYRAVVQGGPSPEKGKRRERLYQVKFDDDDDVVRPVPVEHVTDLV